MLHKIQRPLFITLASLLVMGFGVWMVSSSRAQIRVEEVQNAQLLKEYFLPVSSLVPVDEGKITISAVDCSSVGSASGVIMKDANIYGGKSHKDVAPITNASLYTNCNNVTIDQNLGYSPQLSVGGMVSRKSLRGLEIQKDNATVTYPLNITEPSVYNLSISAFNGEDSFDALTRNQFEAIKNSSAISNSSYPYASFFPADDTSPTNDELAARNILLQVAVNDPKNVVGVISIKDSQEKNFGNLLLGTLQPGQYTLYITYANDLEVNLAFNGADIGKPCDDDNICSTGLSCLNRAEGGGGVGVCSLADEKLNNFASANVTADSKLAKTPVLVDLTVAKTQRTNDVLGVRVFNNPTHVDALKWYQQNLITQGNPVPVTVDGYNGVLDGRTAYINAANISATGDYYTNIYVIAHNVNASPQTIEVYNRIVNNWKFNKNILEIEGDVAGEIVKDRLRRDTRRLEDLNVVREAFERYKVLNGFYPKLEAGTFVRGKVVSTWPTWQSFLGSALGVVMPSDPLNVMSPEFYPQGSGNPTTPRQYNCTDAYESQFCEVACTSDASGVALTGCTANQQCVDASYCSIIPPGYDARTGWSLEKNELYDNEEMKFDNSFVYSYITSDNGESYSFNYRLEYQNFCTERYADGSCKSFSNTRCGPGACFIESLDACISAGESLYTKAGALDPDNKEKYRNLYCFGGAIVNSCGNGILQPDAGETCEFNQDFSTGLYCDANFGQADWYNEANVSDRCSSSCRLLSEVETGRLPVAYNPQAPGQSCGGFCGDNLIQYEYYEQCDLGGNGGILPLPAQGGSGGVSADSQYACTAATGTTVVRGENLLVNGDFEREVMEENRYFLNLNKDQFFSGSTNLGKWVYDGGNNDPTVIDGQEYKYFEWTTRESRSGTRSVFLHKNLLNVSDIETENNWHRALYSKAEILPNSTYDAEVWLKLDEEQSLNDENVNLKLNVSFHDKDGNLLKFANSVNSLIADCKTEAGGATGDYCRQSALISTNEISLDSWSRHAIRFTTPSTAAFVTVNLLANAKEVNGKTYALYADDFKLSGVAGCQTYGGYCGDGSIQARYGEQCDIASHVPPSPRKSVDQFSNTGFEAGLDPWILINKDGIYEVSDLDSPAEIINLSAGVGMVRSGFSALRLDPSVTGMGVAQRVNYQPLSDKTTEIKAQIDVRASELVAGDLATAPLIVQLRAYQYDFTTGQLISYSSGGNTSQYLSTIMTQTTVGALDPASNLNCQQVSNLQLKSWIDSGYRTYTGSITLPAATNSNSNSVTLLGFVLTRCNNGVVTNGEVVGSTSIPPANYIFDNIQINSNYFQQYLCAKKDNKLCQYTGGFCGDGITQSNFGEACDNGDKNGTGESVNGVSCSRFCTFPSCGDGKKDVIYYPLTKTTKTEVCDPSDPNDPNRSFCNGCLRLRPGASCTVSSPDCNCINGFCAAGFGEAGCNPEASGSCPAGSVCDPESAMCRPLTDVYLKSHFDESGLLYGGKNYACPYFTTKTEGGIEVGIYDACTGLTFAVKDSGSHVLYTQAEAGCSPGFILPTVKQLFSLTTGNISTEGVSYPFKDADASTTTYAPNDVTKLCSLTGKVSLSSVSSSNLDACQEQNDPRYVYWTNTPYGSEGVCKDGSNVEVSCDPFAQTNSQCQKPTSCRFKYYYAVDFKKKTVDVLKSDSKVAARCISEQRCNDGVIQGDEQCEFNQSGVEIGIGYSKMCSTHPDAQARAPYTAGNVHCDTRTCKLRFDNCVINTNPATSVSTKVCSNNNNQTCDVNGDCGQGNTCISLTSNKTGTCLYSNKTICAVDSDCGNEGKCVLKNSCDAICSGINSKSENFDPTLSYVKSFGTNLTETYPSGNRKNNYDINRRPKIKSSLSNDGETLLGLGDPQRLPTNFIRENGGTLTQNLNYEYDERDNAPVYDHEIYSDNYSTADDGLMISVSGDTCNFVAPFVADGSTLNTGRVAVGKSQTCTLGFRITDRSQNWKTYDFYASTADKPYFSDVLNGGKASEVSAESTLCRCAVPDLPEVKAVGGITDEVKVLAINNAESLVIIAETTKTLSDFQTAQTAVTELVTVHNITNSAPVDELQRRIDVLAESFVITSENQVAGNLTLTCQSDDDCGGSGTCNLNTNTCTVSDIYSRWKFDEGINRTCYNTGPGRSSRELGTGVDMEITCAGTGCSRTINWPAHKICSNDVLRSCAVDADCASGGVCNSDFRTAVSLDGEDDYMKTSSEYFNLAKGTVSMWVNVKNFNFNSNHKQYDPETNLPVANTDGYPYKQGLFSYYKDDSNFIDLAIDRREENSGERVLSLRINNNEIIRTSPITWTTATWHHLALQYDFENNSYKLFADGVEIGQSSSNLDQPEVNGVVTFGALYQDEFAITGPLPSVKYGAFANAIFDEIRVYDRILSANEINTLRLASDIVIAMAPLKPSTAKKEGFFAGLFGWIRR